MSVMLAVNERSKAWKRLDKAREFAGANNIDDSVFAGELMVHQARITADNANRAAKYSMNTLGTHINKSRQSKRQMYNQKAPGLLMTPWRFLTKTPDSKRAVALLRLLTN